MNERSQAYWIALIARPLRYAAMKTARNAGHIAVKLEIGSSFP
jgi:hypothetical protein